MLLEGRKLLITGVLTDRSIAFSVARRAQEEGAEVILTGFGRGMRITERMAKRLPAEADVLELDVNDPAALEAVAGELDERWGRLDGVLHAIAFVPADALGGHARQRGLEVLELRQQAVAQHLGRDARAVGNEESGADRGHVVLHKGDSTAKIPSIFSPCRGSAS